MVDLVPPFAGLLSIENSANCSISSVKSGVMPVLTKKLLQLGRSAAAMIFPCYSNGNFNRI